MRPEYPCLLARPPGEFMSADAMREAWIVPDHRAASRLAAGDALFQDDRLQALRCRVDGCRETRRSRSNDDDIARVDIVAGGAACRFDDLGKSRFYHRVAVVADHDGQA